MPGRLEPSTRSLRVWGIIFDATAWNRILRKGACALIEKELQRELIWFAYRQNILEMVLGDVFKVIFGETWLIRTRDDFVQSSFRRDGVLLTNVLTAMFMRIFLLVSYQWSKRKCSLSCLVHWFETSFSRSWRVTGSTAIVSIFWRL